MIKSRPKRSLPCLEKLFCGEQTYQTIGWDKPIEAYFHVNHDYETAFSYFTHLMGEKTGFRKAAGRLSAGFIHYNNVRQLMGDFEDWDGSKHEVFADLGTRYTPALAALVQLPDEVVPVQDKNLVKKVFAAEMERRKMPGTIRTSDEQAEFERATQICLDHRADAAKALEPIVGREIELAQKCWRGARRALPYDDRNTLDFEVLATNTQVVLNKYESMLGNKPAGE